MTSMNSPMRPLLFDQSNFFGWISIALHWTSAALIVAMWIIGKNISAIPDGASGFWRTLHITVGLSAWILLAGRVAWRIYSKHPRTNGLTAKIHGIARAVHYLMLASLTSLILSGPIIAWLGPLTLIGSAAFVVHLYAGNVLLILVITHILAAVKHLMFHDDESVIRMLWPKR